MGLYELNVIIGNRLQKAVVMQIAAWHFTIQDRYIRKQLVAFKISESKRKKYANARRKCSLILQSLKTPLMNGNKSNTQTR